MHPDRGINEVITSMESLGHGLGLGAGMALHEKVNKGDYVVMSDGELQDGYVLGMLSQAPALGLNHLIGIFDYSDLHSMHFTTTNSHPKFVSFSGRGSCVWMGVS